MGNIIANICLAVFLILYGIITVSNIRVEWMTPIMGFSALVAGVIIFIVAVTTRRPPP